ncbi:MAG: helix-hairpin-helix domain-containing protein [Chlorobiales bacterium]|nr:helix-hairpin-helix domain-containing protein [Chlorobiales bacterium]
MNPDKVDRNQLEKLTDLPNIGPAIAADLRLLGVNKPDDLAGRSPFELYDMLSSSKGKRQDPCLLDVLISVTRFMDGEDPRPWWHYTAERKRMFGYDGNTG